MTTTTTSAETLQRVPLAKLKLAPENARAHSKDLGDVKGLAGSITAVGDLLDPLHTYPEGDAFMVWDGGRRLAALNLLNKLPPALASGIPVLVSASKAEAQLRSRATFLREGLDPAEEFYTYNALLDAGQSPEMIAAACSVTTPRVKQLLRLRDVAPVILAAFKAHKVPLDVVEAFSISADHKKQAALFASFKGGTIQAHVVKNKLREGAIGADDRLAIFVGRDVYEKAGGAFLQDLFTGRDDEAWADGALARKLADAKIAAMIKEVQAEGWEWVKFADYNDYYYNSRLVQLPKPAGGKWSDDVKATAGVFLKMQHNGTLDVQRGWTSPAKQRAASGSPPVKTAAQSDPARYGYSHKGHHIMTLVATQAVRVGLMRKPETAYDALLSHLAYVTFADHATEGTASKLNPPYRYGPLGNYVAGGNDLDERFKAWKARFAPILKQGRVPFCEAVAALKPKEKAELLALCYGATLDAIEDRIDGHRAVRWQHLGWLAGLTDVDPAAAWTPDKEFLQGGSKDALLAAVKEVGGSEGMQNAKKSEIAGHVAALAKERHWVPKLLSELRVKPAAKPDPELSPALVALAGGGKPTPIKGDDDGE
jgi:ParB-like chromosome segregation protein Spo0J